MSILNLCKTKPIMVDENETIRNVANCMKKYNTGNIIVVTNQKKPVGMITDRDIVMRVIANKIDLESCYAKDVMSKDLLAINENQGLMETIRLMSKKGVRRAPIVKEDQEIVGLVTTDDLLYLLSDEFKRLGDLIREQVA